MNTKDILIGTFVKKNKILSYIEFLKGKNQININRIHIYKMEDNNDEYLVTFKTNNKEKYLQRIRYSTVMHIKNGCIFSINALNRYIEIENGTIDKSYDVNWDILKGKLLVLTSGSLRIVNIERVEDFMQFFA